jgi:hypothetical protein
VDGVDYFYFSDTLPGIRVRADWKAVQDPRRLRSYTCLPQGARFNGDATTLERDDTGRLKWAWKRRHRHPHGEERGANYCAREAQRGRGCAAG